MKHLLFVVLLACSIRGNAQANKGTELFSPQTNVSLHIYRDTFELSLLSFTYDVIHSKPLYHGKYRLLNDTLFLTTQNNRTFKLHKETFEIYSPVDLDTLTNGQKFLAWTIYYPNGKLKQTGGWTKQNVKEGVWQYYDSTGNTINKKLFKDGVLVTDNFKFAWEKNPALPNN